MARDRVVAVGALLLVAAVGAWAAWGLRVETEITHFLPGADDRELAEISSELASSELTRTATLTLEAPTAERAGEAALAMAAALEGAPGVRWVSAGPDEAMQQAFYEAYFSRRLGLHPADATFDEDAIRARVRRLKTLLGSPTGTFVRQLAPQDPWLLFLDRMEGLRAGQGGGLAVRDGAYVAGEDQRFGVVLLTSDTSPFDAAGSRALQAAIADAFAEVNESGDLTLEQSSIHAIALRSEASIRGDIQRVSTLGTLGVILLVLLFFRRPRYLVLSALPLAGGFAVGLAVTRLTFGSVHGLTLAFGATLVGVSLDYVAHLVSHHLLDPPEPGTGRAGWRTLRRIAPGLVLGAATTVAGLVGLAWTSFPGIRQMAVFTSAGVAAALVLTAVVLPPFLPEAPRATRIHARLGLAMDRLLGRLARKRGWLVVLPLVALGLTAGIAGLRWEDDLRALSPVDADLRAEDERVRDRVARMDAGRLVVARGATLQEALERNDAVADALGVAVEAKELEAFRSLRDILPSEATQRARRAAVPDDAWELTVGALREEGFVEAPFEPFREALEAPFEPLSADDLPPALDRLARTQRLELDDGGAVLTFVTGVSDADAVAARVDAIEGVRFFDQAEFVASAYRELRRRTLELVGLGLLAVLLLVFLRYRRIGPTLAAFLPALLAAGATLGLLGVLGMQATLLHVVALLLVLSMGVDYGVFMVEAEAHGSGPATAVSLVVACLSTMASFGVLATSTNPALSAMGLTAAVGVIASLLLAPTAWLLLVRRGQPPGKGSELQTTAGSPPPPTTNEPS